MSDFITKIDWSSNRQVIQDYENFASLSGGTVFGVPFASLPSGTDPSNSGTTYTATTIISTFSGNTGTTNYVFGDSNMNIASPYMPIITNINSGSSFSSGNIFISTSSTTLDNNTINHLFSGVSFDFSVTHITQPSGIRSFSGTLLTNTLYYLSATSLDYKSRLIYVDTPEVFRARRFIMTQSPVIGYVLTCSNPDGTTSWMPSSGSGGTGSDFWSAGTGINACMVQNYSNGISSGDSSIAAGYRTQAIGNYSFAAGKSYDGRPIIAAGLSSFNFSTNDSTQTPGYGCLGKCSAIIGGINHNIDSGNLYNFIGGGYGGNISSSDGLGVNTNSSIIAGSGNTLIETLNSCIVDGHDNIIQIVSTGIASECAIVGGDNASINGDGGNITENIILGGSYNSIASQGGNTISSGIVAGNNNLIKNATNCVIIGGSTSVLYNPLSNISSSVIIGGEIDISATVGLAQDNTVYVPYLNIGKLNTKAVIDLGLDANGFVAPFVSDESLKTNIKTITNSLDKLLKLRGVSYNWKDDNKETPDTQIGFIAQEVEKIIPELTSYYKDIKTVKYKDFTALIVEAIKELYETRKTKVIESEKIIAEDNNIELNYGGIHDTAINGGIKIIKGIDEDNDSEITIDKDGNFNLNTGLKANKLFVRKYTPIDSKDINISNDEVVYDDNYIYVKSNDICKRIKLESF